MPPGRGVNGRLWSAALIGVLLFADGALVGVLAGPRIMRARSSLAAGHEHEKGAIDWTRPTPSDLRVAAVFGALQRDGLAAALDALEQAAAQDSSVLRGGHQLAHALGRMAVATHAGDAAVIRQCRPDFASGCYHGVVEAAVQARGRVDMAELERMCLGAGGEDHPGAVHECMHGLGHGVLGATDFDLDAGLHDCDALTAAFASWCYSGAFMEAIDAAVGESRLGGGHSHHGAMDHGAMDHGTHSGDAGSPGHQLAIDPQDPYSPCDRFADPYATECWVFQGFVILRAQGLDARKALGVCDQAPQGRVVSCYTSIGLQLAGLFQREDVWVVDQCRLGRPEFSPHCGAGAARALVQIDWSGGRAMRFCAAVPAGWKDACYGTAAGTLAAFAAPSARATVCGTVEQAYVEPCRTAAGLAPRT